MGSLLYKCGFGRVPTNIVVVSIVCFLPFLDLR